LSEGFAGLQLSRETLAALSKAKLVNPTPLQAKVIPHALLGRDIIAVSDSGAGRTTAFLLALVERLSNLAGTRALVLARNKQRITQIHEQFDVLSVGRTFKVSEILSGGAMAAQEQELRERRPVLLANPTRLTEHMDRGAVNFSSIEMVVLDAADEMVGEGLLPQLKRIVNRLPPRRQTLIFTRTLLDALAAFARTSLRDPILVEVASSEPAPVRPEPAPNEPIRTAPIVEAETVSVEPVAPEPVVPVRPKPVEKPPASKPAPKSVTKRPSSKKPVKKAPKPKSKRSAPRAKAKKKR
jgi:superfamily II DNA/RNA helicase